MHSNKSNKTIVASYFEQLDSTNAEAIRRLRSKDLRPGQRTFIYTGHQTIGRGQAGNGWFDSAGQNVLASLVYYPTQLAASNIFALTQLSSLAVATTVDHFSSSDIKVCIKWPNDIYVTKAGTSGDFKVAGILVQNSLVGSAVQWSVIGIGLNVNEQDFPPELASSATSLQLLNGGTPLDLAACRDHLFATLLATIDRFTEPTLDRPALQKAYLERLYRMDVMANYQNLEAGVCFKGTIRGVNTQGQLIVEHSIGRLQTYDLKSIRFLP